MPGRSGEDVLAQQLPWFSQAWPSWLQICVNAVTWLPCRKPAHLNSAPQLTALRIPAHRVQRVLAGYNQCAQAAFGLAQDHCRGCGRLKRLLQPATETVWVAWAGSAASAALKMQLSQPLLICLSVLHPPAN